MTHASSQSLRPQRDGLRYFRCERRVFRQRVAEKFGYERRSIRSARVIEWQRVVATAPCVTEPCDCDVAHDEAVIDSPLQCGHVAVVARALGALAVGLR